MCAFDTTAPVTRDPRAHQPILTNRCHQAGHSPATHLRRTRSVAQGRAGLMPPRDGIRSTSRGFGQERSTPPPLSANQHSSRVPGHHMLHRARLGTLLVAAGCLAVRRPTVWQHPHSLSGCTARRPWHRPLYRTPTLLADACIHVCPLRQCCSAPGGCPTHTHTRTRASPTCQPQVRWCRKT